MRYFYLKAFSNSLRSGLLAILSGILFFSSQAQVASNLRVKTIAWEGDSLVVDKIGRAACRERV